MIVKCGHKSPTNSHDVRRGRTLPSPCPPGRRCPTPAPCAVDEWTTDCNTVNNPGNPGPSTETRPPASASTPAPHDAPPATPSPRTRRPRRTPARSHRPPPRPSPRSGSSNAASNADARGRSNHDTRDATPASKKPATITPPPGDLVLGHLTLPRLRHLRLFRIGCPDTPVERETHLAEGILRSGLPPFVRCVDCLPQSPHVPTSAIRHDYHDPPIRNRFLL